MLHTKGFRKFSHIGVIRLFILILYRPCIVINCIKSLKRCTSSYVFILKFALYMFRKDTPFVISSLRITVYRAVCTYHANRDYSHG